MFAPRLACRRLFSRDAAVYALLFAFSAVVALLYASHFAQLYYAYSGDSVYYIEAARSLLRGEPLDTTSASTFGVVGPLALFPPGYPVLIAALGLVGIDPVSGSLWISRLSLVMLGPAVFWALRCEISVALSAFAAALAVTSLGMVQMAQLAHSNSLYALISVLSIGALCRGLMSWSHRLLLSAGVLAGLSLTVRNAAIPLLVAHCLTIVVDCWRARRPFRQVFAGTVAWASGALPPILALAVWNIVGVGTVLPYDMPPSTIGMSDNIRTMAYAFCYDMIPIFGPIRYTVERDWLDILVYAAFVAGVIWINFARKYSRRGPRNLSVFAMCYVTLGAVVLIAARTRYQWGGIINERLTSQYDWLFLTVVAATIANFNSRRQIAILLCCCTVILGIRGRWFLERLSEEAAATSNVESLIEASNGTDGTDHANARQFWFRYSVSPELKSFVQDLPTICTIATNLYNVVNVSMQRTAFNLDEEAFMAPSPQLRAFNAKGGPDIIIVGVTPMLLSEGMTWRERVASAVQAEAPRYAPIQQSGPFLAFARDGGCGVR